LLLGALSPCVWQNQLCLKNYVVTVGTKKTCFAQIPTIHRLPMLRDAHTFPVPQSNLQAALFGGTFSFEPTVPGMSTLHKGGMRQRSG